MRISRWLEKNEYLLEALLILIIIYTFISVAISINKTNKELIKTLKTLNSKIDMININNDDLKKMLEILNGE